MVGGTMRNSLSEPVDESYIDPLLNWIKKCPKCGSGTDNIYKNGIVNCLGSGCRECKLLWQCSQKGKTITLTAAPWKPAEVRRNYEIVVTYTSHCVRAETKEEARKKLIKRLKADKNGDAYRIRVEHHGDDAEMNEGIC